MNRQETEQSYQLMMDPEVRRMFRDDPAAALQELEARGHALLDAGSVQEIKVVFGTKGKMYIPLPRIGTDHALSGEELGRIHAGGAVSTAGSASSLSTFGTAPFTISTLSSVGSAGSAGSVDV